MKSDESLVNPENAIEIHENPQDSRIFQVYNSHEIPISPIKIPSKSHEDVRKAENSHFSVWIWLKIIINY